MSTNRSVAGISAPVIPFLRKPEMQFWQIAGFPGNRAKPMCRSTAPPGPPKGAEHSLQRGSGEVEHPAPDRREARMLADEDRRNSSWSSSLGIAGTVRRSLSVPEPATADDIDWAASLEEGVRSMFYAARGNIPPKRHTQHRAPDGSLYAEELFGVEGFTGRSSLLYHVTPPTQTHRIEPVDARSTSRRPTTATTITG